MGPRVSCSQSVKTTNRVPEGVCDSCRGPARRCAGRKAKISGRKPRSSHTPSPFTPKRRLSERFTWLRRASAARSARGLATRAHVSTQDVFDEPLRLVNEPRVPAASGNLVRTRHLRIRGESRGEAFHDALNLLRIGVRARRGCERYLLESTYSDQTSDTPVAPPTRTSLAPKKGAGEPVRKRRRPFATRPRERPYRL